ncbi:hypothetical protein SDC9_138486 [bioreactor metagenome]|uniref:Uncharacterized protein n=1 Tax=bioreactor metagenome TaxID=1076179 RepID=A0A645DQD7_9ZZZZ
MPSAFNHSPVGFISVHCDVHSAAAGCYSGIEMAVIDRIKKSFKRQDIIKGACFSDIASVKQGMYTDKLDALGFSFGYESLEMINVRMNVSIGKQTNKMQRRAVAFAISNYFSPSASGK